MFMLKNYDLTLYKVVFYSIVGYALVQLPDLLLNLYDYLDEKRIVRQERQRRAHSNVQQQLDVISNPGLEVENSAEQITQDHQTSTLPSQESTYIDEEAIKSAVQRRVEYFLENEVDRCMDV